jgi:hypothetical protein
MNLDKIVYETLNKVTRIKIAKDSPLRDSMFWYLIIITIIYMGVIFWGITR